MPIPDDLFTLRECLTKWLSVTIPPDSDTELGPLLDRVVVGHNEGPIVNLEIQQRWSYNELVDALREALLHRKGSRRNALVTGYQLANSQGASSAAHSTASSINGSIIKGNEWRHLYLLLGNITMCALLTRFVAFERKGVHFVQLFGDAFDEVQYRSESSPFFSLDKAMYKETHTVKHMNPLPLETNELLIAIFKEEFQRLASPQKIPPSLKKFRLLAARIITNHQDISYNHIFNNICPEEIQPSKEYLDLAISPDYAMKFCTITFEKIFPLDTYGTANNKSIIFGSLARLLNGEKGTKLRIEECLSGLKISTIPWLGKGYTGKLNKQDTEKRERLLRQLICWVFSEFFPKLLSSFFHITHISSGKQLFFFRHDTWRRISRPYLENYTTENLRLALDPLSVSQSGSTGVLPSKLRIMPKKNSEFRAISVPRRGFSKEDLHKYNDHIYKEIRPAKRILNHIRIREKSFFPKLTSVNQIPTQIALFKQKMTAETCDVPSYFFLKFDAKSCYDTLPHSKIIEILSQMVELDKPYHYSEERNLDLESMKVIISRTYGTLKDIRMQTMDRKSPAIMGRRRQHVLRGREILDICRSQLEDTVTRTNNATYSRSKGIFQGMHMSSLFCDLVYDELIATQFGFLTDTNSLVLRIADDFLIISTDVGLLLKMKRMATCGFPEFGVTINELKSVANFGSQGQGLSFAPFFTFCGYNIHTDTLDVVKEYDSSMVYKPYVRSHKAALHRMLGIFKIRMRQNNWDTDLNPQGKMITQLTLLASNIALSYYNTTKRLQVSGTGFAHLINGILKESIGSLRGSLKRDTKLISELKAVILRAFVYELQKKGEKYKQCINILNSELQRIY